VPYVKIKGQITTQLTRCLVAAAKLTEKWKLHATPHPKFGCGALSGQSES
jgi:hypothetical protein